MSCSRCILESVADVGFESRQVMSHSGLEQCSLSIKIVMYHDARSPIGLAAGRNIGMGKVSGCLPRYFQDLEDPRS